jgi:hypothetical protein
VHFDERASGRGKLRQPVEIADREGTGVKADANIDPWIFSAGIGYRFNLFGPRAEAAPMK